MRINISTQYCTRTVIFSKVFFGVVLVHASRMIAGYGSQSPYKDFRGIELWITLTPKAESALSLWWFKSSHNLKFRVKKLLKRMKGGKI